MARRMSSVRVPGPPALGSRLRSRRGRGRLAGRPADRLSNGVSIFCKPAIRWLVSRARSVRSLIWSSLTVICLQKIVLAFEALDVRGRALSRLVGSCRRLGAWLLVALLRCDICRVLSRHAATGRDLSHLLDVRDVLVQGGGGDQVFFTEWCLDPATIEVALRAVALNAARGAGEPGAGVALDGLFDGEGEIAVGGGRDVSRQVVGHCIDDTAARPTSRRLFTMRQ